MLPYRLRCKYKAVIIPSDTAGAEIYTFSKAVDAVGLWPSPFIYYPQYCSLKGEVQNSDSDCPSLRLCFMLMMAVRLLCSCCLSGGVFFGSPIAFCKRNEQSGKKDPETGFFSPT